MCTCIKVVNENFYFGRNLDLDYNFGERVVVTPRNYKWKWRNIEDFDRSYAIIGMANIIDNYPLYADGCNEHGLCMAGLNFPGICVYKEKEENKINIAPFEFIPYILARCRNVGEAKIILKKLNICNENFSENIPAAPLHFMISDRNESIVVESTKDGLNVYENHVNVLTNNPDFTFHLYNLENYMNLSISNLSKGFGCGLKASPYGEGLGAYGLPGDLSPMSRFIRAAFYTNNFVADKDEYSNVNQFFRVLDSVAMVKGAVLTESGKWDITTYSCCINADEGVYYYRTYDNCSINAISLFNCNIDEEKLFSFELINKGTINYIN